MKRAGVASDWIGVSELELETGLEEPGLRTSITFRDPAVHHPHRLLCNQFHGAQRLRLELEVRLLEARVLEDLSAGLL